MSKQPTSTDSLNSPEDYLRKAAVESKFSDITQCIDIIAAGIKVFPASPELYCDLGRRLYILSLKNKDARILKQAIVAFEAVAALDWSKGWYDLSKALEDDHQYEAALVICRKELGRLDGLKPGRDYRASPHAKFFQKLSTVRSLERHRAAMKRCIDASDFKQALAECRATIVSWELAYEITG
jgi:hypothetical protein